MYMYVGVSVADIVSVSHVHRVGYLSGLSQQLDKDSKASGVIRVLFIPSLRLWA